MINNTRRINYKEHKDKADTIKNNFTDEVFSLITEDPLLSEDDYCVKFKNDFMGYLEELIEKDGSIFKGLWTALERHLEK